MVGTAVWSPHYTSSPSGCREPFPVQRRGLAGKEQEQKSAGGFGPFSPLGLHPASRSFCLFVCFPSRLLTFYSVVFCTPEKLRH